jgi:hypothetical protein
LTWSLTKQQGLGDDQDVTGGPSQSLVGHLFLGAVGKVTASFLGQWAILLACQRIRILQKSLEHGRTSRWSDKGEWFDYAPEELRGVRWIESRRSRNAKNPHAPSMGKF